MTTILDLPVEIISDISFYFRDLKSVAHMLLVCKKINIAIVRGLLWDSLLAYKSRMINVKREFKLRRGHWIYGNKYYICHMFVKENFKVAKKLNKSLYKEFITHEDFMNERSAANWLNQPHMLFHNIGDEFVDGTDVFNMCSVLHYRNNNELSIEYNDIVDGEVVQKYRVINKNIYI